jgi:hypothetical protein
MVGFAIPTLKRGANNHCACGAEVGLLPTLWPSRSASYLRRGGWAAADALAKSQCVVPAARRLGCCRRFGQVAVCRTCGAEDGLLRTLWPSRSVSYLRRGGWAAADALAKSQCVVPAARRMGCCRRFGQVAVCRTCGAEDGLLPTLWPSRSASYLRRGRRAAVTGALLHRPFEGPPGFLSIDPSLLGRTYRSHPSRKNRGAAKVGRPVAPDRAPDYFR